MQTADLEVIKEIPGYKVILKAVLKTQIQQLVEQLADHTGEESVILTASVSDGTLSHLGSDSGKVFLQDHDDIKTQFLGFCLKRHHKLKQQEKEKQQQQEKLLEASNRLMNIPTTPTRYGTGIRPRFTPTRVQTSPRQPQFSPRFQTSPRPTFGSPNQGRMQSAPRLPTVPVSGSSPEGAQRVGIDSVRHEPYPQVRPRRTSLNFNQQGRSPNPNPGVNQKQSVNTMRLPTEPQKVPKINIDPNEVIKIEAADDDDVEEVVQVKTKSKTESTAKQPENVSSEMGIKIASVSGATETEVTADPVSHETLKTSESAVSETSTLSSAPSPSTSTPAISSAMPVLSPIPKDESSNSSAATLPNETADSKVNDIPPEGLSLDSDLSKLTGIPNDGIKTDEKSNSSSAASSVVGTVSQESGSGTEPSVNVKVEALTESEMELEITGIEPGQVKQGASNVQSGIDFGPSTSGLSGMGEGVGSEMNPEYKKPKKRGRPPKTVRRDSADAVKKTAQGVVVSSATVSSNSLTVVSSNSSRNVSPNTLDELKAQEKDAINSWSKTELTAVNKTNTLDDVIIVDDQTDPSKPAQKKRKLEQTPLNSNKNNNKVVDSIVNNGSDVNKQTANNGSDVNKQTVTDGQTHDNTVEKHNVEKIKCNADKNEVDDVVLIDLNEETIKPSTSLPYRVTHGQQNLSYNAGSAVAEKNKVQNVLHNTRLNSKGTPELVIDVDEVDGNSNAVSASNRTVPPCVQQVESPVSHFGQVQNNSTPGKTLVQTKIAQQSSLPNREGQENLYYFSPQPTPSTNIVSPPVSPQLKYNQPPMLSPMPPSSPSLSPPMSPQQAIGVKGFLPPVSPQQKQIIPKFNCGDCGKAFASNAALTTHHRTHTGDKPFECDVCGKKFTAKQSVKNHILKQHFKEAK